jgi:hypothetical protein
MFWFYFLRKAVRELAAFLIVRGGDGKIGVCSIHGHELAGCLFLKIIRLRSAPACRQAGSFGEMQYGFKKLP